MKRRDHRDSRHLLDKILQHFYEELIDPQQWEFYISIEQAIPQIQKILDINHDQAQVIWKFIDGHYLCSSTDEDAYLPSHELIERVAVLRDDVPVDIELQEELVTHLYNSYSETPTQPAVHREQIYNEFEESSIKLHLNLYILKTTGWVETGTLTNTDDGSWDTIELKETRY